MSNTGGGTYSGITDSVTWSLGTLAAGDDTTVTLTVKVNSSRTADLSNTATVSATTADATAGNNSDTELTTVNENADLEVTKSDAGFDPVIAGNNVTYSINVNNLGPSDAVGASLTDAIPAGTTYVSNTGGGTYSGITDSVTWSLGTLAAGDDTTVTLTVKVNSSRTADLSNTATVSATTADATAGNNSDTELTTVNENADLEVTKSDAGFDPVIAGNNVTYSINVNNLGPSDAVGASLTDAIPAGTTYVSNTGGGTYSGITDSVTWSLGTLAAGDDTTVTLTVKVNSSRTADLSNTATVSATTADATAGNNSDTELTTVNENADLEVTKSDAGFDPVIAGNNVTYSINVNNLGPSDAVGASLTDAIPAGTTYVSNTGGGTYSGITDSVTWSLGTLAAGDDTTVTLTVKVNSSRTADLSNTATVSATTADATAGNNSDTELTTVTLSSDL